MSVKTRDKLRPEFATGETPSQEDFADLIDSALNQIDDGISKAPNDPLTIRAVEETGDLLRFTRPLKEQEPVPTWTISQQSNAQTQTTDLLFLAADGSAQKPAFYVSANGNVGIGLPSPQAKLHVDGDLIINGPLQLKAPDNEHANLQVDFGKGYRLFCDDKDSSTTGQDISVAAKSRLWLDSPNGGQIVVGPRVDSSALDDVLFRSSKVSFDGALSFGNHVRQMLNLWGTQYGIGVQDHTQYFRTDGDFAWYQGGIHNDERRIPGSGGKALMVIKDEKVGIEADSPVAKLDVQQGNRTGSHPSAVNGLYVTGDLGGDSDGVEFRHSNGTQGIGFGYNTIYAAGSSTNQDLNLKPRGTGKVGVAAPLSVNGRITISTYSYIEANPPRTGPVRLGGSWGWVEIGPDNRSNPCYFKTSQASYRFDKEVKIDGNVVCGTIFEPTKQRFLNLEQYEGSGGNNGIAILPHADNHGGLGKSDRRWDDGYITEIYGNVQGSSDVRLKTGIRPLENVLDKLSKLNGIQFRWKDHERASQSNRGLQIGLIADQVEQVFPELVTQDVDGFKYLRYDRFVAVLLQAVKELQDIVANQTR